MPKFSYQAKSYTGEIVTGDIEAANESEARVKIRANRLIPIKVLVGGVEAVSQSGGGGFLSGLLKVKVKSKELQVFTRQLSVLISAGVPLVPSLEALAHGAKTPTLKEAIGCITQDISSGKKMGDAFNGQSHVFDNFYVNMVVAGEEGGVLETVLQRLAIYIEKAVKLQNQIKGALIYPIAVLVIALAVVTGLLIFVVPKFAELFAGNGMKLPWLTQVVLDASHVLQERWWVILIIVVGIIIGFKEYYKSTAGRSQIDAILLKLPLFGDLMIKGGLAKFSRTLATLISAGVPVMDAMEIGKQVSGNFILEQAIGRAKESISEGKSMAVPFSQEPVIPNLVVQMIAVGEQTGSLDTMLSKVADFFEDEVEALVSNLTSLIEPIMIVGLGGIIAFLVVAMYLPIFQMAGAQSGG